MLMHANGLYRVINKPYHIAPYHTIFSLILSQIMWYHMFLIKYNVLSENYLKFKYRLGYGYSTSIAARGGGGSFKRLKLYNSEEHLPIESFVTTLIH